MKSKEKSRPKSNTDIQKEKSLEYVQDITTCDDPDVLSNALRDEYQSFVIDPKLLKSESVAKVPMKREKIPVKVLKHLPVSNEQKAKVREKVLVARRVKAEDYPSCKLFQKTTGDISNGHTATREIDESILEEAKLSRRDGSSKNELTENDLTARRKKGNNEMFRTDGSVSINEKNALSNWTKQMNQWKNQQNLLSKSLNVASDELLMNQSDHYRSIQEERTLIDRSMPSKDYGKGYRVSSEFWKQTESLPKDECVNITLSETEKGNAPPLEHVGYPSSIRKEMGMDWNITNRMKFTHYPWWKSEYLQERRRHLQNVMDELKPNNPDLHGLEIIGKSIICPELNNQKIADLGVEEVDNSFESIYDDSPIVALQEDPFSEFDDVIEQTTVGPSLLINEFSAKWQENGTSDGLDIRLLFESEIGSTGVENILIKNNGTTAIHYCWKRVPAYNPYDIDKGRLLKRFFFDLSDGVILPGDSHNIQFVFKSPNAGIFTDTWQFETLPTLCGEQSILISLHGIATETDEFEEDRIILENNLEKKQNKVMVDRILNEILASIKTPERPSTPVDAYLTEDNLFKDKNPNLHFHLESVNEIKNLHKELDPNTEWDLSMNSIMAHLNSYNDEEEREDKYQRMNTCIKKLNFEGDLIAPKLKAASCYLVLCDAFDKFADRAYRLNASFGFPDKELVVKSSELSTKKSRKNDVDMANRSRTDSKGARKEASAKKGKDRTKQKDSSIVSKSNEIENDQTVDVANSTLNSNYMEKLYMEVYNCLSEMAVNLETVLED